MTKYMAATVRNVMMGSPVRLVTMLPAWVSSTSPVTVTREESFTRPMRKPTPGGTMIFLAWGMTTYRSFAQ